ncbi:hypothetical protein ACFV7R_30000 [Streptomyces sp. NPDC059866]
MGAIAGAHADDTPSSTTDRERERKALIGPDPGPLVPLASMVSQ